MDDFDDDLSNASVQSLRQQSKDNIERLRHMQKSWQQHHSNSNNIEIFVYKPGKIYKSLPGVGVNDDDDTVRGIKLARNNIYHSNSSLNTNANRAEGVNSRQFDRPPSKADDLVRKYSGKNSRNKQGSFSHVNGIYSNNLSQTYKDPYSHYNDSGLPSSIREDSDFKGSNSTLNSKQRPQLYGLEKDLHTGAREYSSRENLQQNYSVRTIDDDFRENLRLDEEVNRSSDDDQVEDGLIDDPVERLYSTSNHPYTLSDNVRFELFNTTLSDKYYQKNLPTVYSDKNSVNSNESLAKNSSSLKLKPKNSLSSATSRSKSKERVVKNERKPLKKINTENSSLHKTTRNIGAKGGTSSKMNTSAAPKSILRQKQIMHPDRRIRSSNPDLSRSGTSSSKGGGLASRRSKPSHHKFVNFLDREEEPDSARSGSLRGDLPRSRSVERLLGSSQDHNSGAQKYRLTKQDLNRQQFSGSNSGAENRMKSDLNVQTSKQVNLPRSRSVERLLGSSQDHNSGAQKYRLTKQDLNRQQFSGSNSGAENRMKSDLNVQTSKQQPSRGRELSDFDDRPPALLGYDWISGVLDNEKWGGGDGVGVGGEEMLQRLRKFRQNSKQDCVGSVRNIHTDTGKKKGHEEFRDPLHTCIHGYVVDERLFTRPVNMNENGDSVCPVCNKERTEPTNQNPAYVRVSVPRSVVEEPYEIRSKTRGTTDNFDSCSLAEHCETGYRHLPPARKPHTSRAPPSNALDLHSAVGSVKAHTITTEDELRRFADLSVRDWTTSEAQHRQELRQSSDVPRRHETLRNEL